MPRTGLEPACLSTHAPETCASTNSATWAKIIVPTFQRNMSGKRDSNSRPNLGKVMLYQLSYFRIFSFAVAKVGIFRKHANILPTFFTEICSLCTYRKTIILIINSFGHDNLHKKIACIFQLSPLLSKWQWQDDEFR